MQQHFNIITWLNSFSVTYQSFSAPNHVHAPACNPAVDLYNHTALSHSSGFLINCALTDLLQFADVKRVGLWMALQSQVSSLPEQDTKCARIGCDSKCNIQTHEMRQLFQCLVVVIFVYARGRLRCFELHCTVRSPTSKLLTETQ